MWNKQILFSLLWIEFGLSVSVTFFLPNSSTGPANHDFPSTIVYCLLTSIQIWMDFLNSLFLSSSPPLSLSLFLSFFPYLSLSVCLTSRDHIDLILNSFPVFSLASFLRSVELSWSPSSSFDKDFVHSNLFAHFEVVFLPGDCCSTQTRPSMITVGYFSIWKLAKCGATNILSLLEYPKKILWLIGVCKTISKLCVCFIPSIHPQFICGCK